MKRTIPSSLNPRQLDALKIIQAGAYLPSFIRESDGWHARWVALDGAVNEWIDYCVRKAVVSPLSADAENQQHETLHDAWLAALKSRTGLVRWAEPECQSFAQVLKDWSRTVQISNSTRSSLRFELSSTESGFRLMVNSPSGMEEYLALGNAIVYYGKLRGLVKAADGKLELPLTIAEAEHFLKVDVPELHRGGYSVKGIALAAAITASCEIEAPEKPDEPIRTKLQIKVAGEIVSEQEIRFLLDQGSSLVFFRDRWIEVDRNILKAALRALEKFNPEKPGEVLAFAMGIGHVGQFEIEELKLHGWIRGLVNDLRRKGDPKLDVLSDVSAIAGLTAELRTYQRRGVAWLRFMTENGFGALLADDMGLGKTVQTIAWILAERENKPSLRVLVVAPLTLIANWRHEIANFAPSLKVYAHHGERRHLQVDFRDAVNEVDIVITSYQLLVKDYRLFSQYPWDALVIDEAQLIKNPATTLARSIKALSPHSRIALTGTPIENSVADLWSIEDFLNPGFLGDAKTFRNRFQRPLAANPQSSVGTRLRHALEPFVMRRLKSDPSIAVELGEKREIREYCELDAATRRRYENALADYRLLEHTAGDAFALLTELKLICDGTGKLARTLDLLAEIFDGGESALIFTQYVKIGEWLIKEMEKRFERKFPFLHGSLSATAREREIKKFLSNAEPSAFVLSLKAGGTGLNLTKATHVIHFDRWWNPAVEDQATDRTHRIGQAKDVWVHLMITQGTVEEHVDELLKRKQSLKGIIADGEAFYETIKLEP